MSINLSQRRKDAKKQRKEKEIPYRYSFAALRASAPLREIFTTKCERMCTGEIVERSKIKGRLDGERIEFSSEKA